MEQFSGYTFKWKNNVQKYIGTKIHMYYIINSHVVYGMRKGICIHTHTFMILISYKEWVRAGWKE